MRILVHEERITRPDVVQAVEFNLRTLPSIPALLRQRMRRRPQAKQIDHHQLAVMVPPRLDESGLRFPAHRQRLFSLQQPTPIHALVYLRGQVANLRIVKIRAAGQRPAEENRGIDRGYFRLKIAVATLHVEEMKEKPMHVTQAGGGKTQRVSNALADFLAVLPTSMVCNAQSSESKSSRSDACGWAGIRSACLAAVFYEAGIWIRFFPKIPETGSLQLFQKSVFCRREPIIGWIADELRGGLTLH